MAAPNLSNIERRVEALERANAASNTRMTCCNIAPLGLWAFALTTALLQIKSLRAGASENALGIVIGFAFGFGGLVQLIAGLISAANGKQFAAVAFSSYGAFERMLLSAF